jgi:hypothetical protein
MSTLAKLSAKQQREIDCLRYFQLPISKYAAEKTRTHSLGVSQKRESYHIKKDVTGVSPEVAYFLITDQGKKDIVVNDVVSLYQLMDAKRWRLRMVDMYEQGVLEGTVPYFTILGGEDKPIPEYVASFLAKTMFEGSDKDKIMDLYKEICQKD